MRPTSPIIGNEAAWSGGCGAVRWAWVCGTVRSGRCVGAVRQGLAWQAGHGVA